MAWGASSVQDAVAGVLFSEVMKAEAYVGFAGKVYGRLTIERIYFDGKYWRAECKCACGNRCSPALGDIKKPNRATRSCGCIALEVASRVHMKHGNYTKELGLHGGTPEYISWQAMKGRCLRKTNASYKHYGERGITICERWLNSFENFLADMGKKPSPEHQLDRIDSNGNYCPENCKWSGAIEQSNNRRGNIKYEFNGELLTAPMISRKLGLPIHAIRARLRGGMTLHQAIHHKKYSLKRVA